MGQFTPSNVRHALGHLPQDLDLSYQATLSRILSKPTEIQQIAFKVLSWTLHATRPLSVFELLDAVSLEEWTIFYDPENALNEDFILECCMGLVTQRDGMVYFSHSTAQHYLRAHGNHLMPSSYLAKVCLTCLLFENISTAEIGIGTRVDAYYPLHNYAACNWMVHLKGDGERDPETLERVRVLFADRSKFEAIHGVCSIHTPNQNRTDDPRRNSTFTSPLHLAARFGLTQITKLLLKGEWGANVCHPSRDSEGRSVLHEACNQSDPEMVEMVIRWDPCCLNGQDSNGRTPLHYAVQAGSVEVMKVLFKYQADSNVKDIWGWDALQIALAWREEEAAGIVIDSLFKDTTSVSQQRDGTVGGWFCDGYTLLHQAANSGYVPAVKRLLEAGADPLAETSMGSTPLTFATRNGHDEVVTILLSAMNNVLKSTHLGTTPLHRACQWGQTDTAKTLLAADGGACVNAKNWLGFTPLHWAAAGGHEGTAKVLLEVAEIDLTQDAGVPSPIQLAVWGGHQDVVSLLLQEATGDRDLPSLSFESVARVIKQFNSLSRAFGPDNVLPKRCTGGIELCHYYGVTQMKAQRLGMAAAWFDVALMIDSKNSGVKSSNDVICTNKVCDGCQVGPPLMGPYFTCTICVRPCYDLCSACHQSRSTDHAHNQYLKVPSTTALHTFEEYVKILWRTMERELPKTIFHNM